MKAARLFAYDEAPRLVEVPEPKITGPLDVIVPAAAGLRGAPAEAAPLAVTAR